MKAQSRFGALVMFAACSCTTGGIASVGSGQCQTETELLAGVTLASATPAQPARVAEGVLARSTAAAQLSGPCSQAIVGANTAQLLARSGVVLDLLGPPGRDGNYRLGVHSGTSTFDLAGTGDRAGPAIAAPFDFTSDAIDPSTSVDRHIGVKNGAGSAVVEFVDVDRGTGDRQTMPLLTVPYRLRSAYYFPAPDSKAGTITILAAGTGAVTWISVDR